MHLGWFNHRVRPHLEDGQLIFLCQTTRKRFHNQGTKLLLDCTSATELWTETNACVFFLLSSSQFPTEKCEVESTVSSQVATWCAFERLFWSWEESAIHLTHIWATRFKHGLHPAGRVSRSTIPPFRSPLLQKEHLQFEICCNTDVTMRKKRYETLALEPLRSHVALKIHIKLPECFHNWQMLTGKQCSRTHLYFWLPSLWVYNRSTPHTLIVI